MNTRRLLRRAGLVMAATALAASAQQPRGFRTGPAVGEKIPAFEAVDQHGNKQTLDSLKGPNGLMLVFVRSADW